MGHWAARTHPGVTCHVAAASDFSADSTLQDSKAVYVVGCIVQGLAIVGFGLVGLRFEGTMAGMMSIALITAFALGRSLSSISHKDVLAKTVDIGRRGSVSGIAGSIAAATTLLLALGYASGWLPLTVPVVARIVIIGGASWLLAAQVFNSIMEFPGATEGSMHGLTAVVSQFTLLRTDAELRWLIVTRTLLLSTALAPPFYVALSSDYVVSGLGTLGLFMMASATAVLASSYFWGRLADRSSRRVLIYAATLGALTNGMVAILVLVMPEKLAFAPILPLLLFVLTVAHQGVRLGRSVHITDMADIENRATYTALSNSIVGVILLAGGVFGFLARWFGLGIGLTIFALMAALAIPTAMQLRDVQTIDAG